MGSLYRSEEMTLCQLFLQHEATYNCISHLGELGLVMFRDLNTDVNSFSKKYVNEIRRCNEMETKLNYISRELKRYEVPEERPEEDILAPQPKELIDLEAAIEKLEHDLREVHTNAAALKQSYVELIELKQVLIKAKTFFEDQLDVSSHMDLSMESALVSHEIPSAPTQLGFVIGVMLRERMAAFEVMLWRVCHGNVYLKQAEMEMTIEDPLTGNQVRKDVFIVFFQGERLKSRVKKICEGFRATLYPCPESSEEREETLKGVKTRLEDVNQVLSQTSDHQHRLLVSAAKTVRSWLIKVLKVKAIYNTMNMFNQDVAKECQIAECWCPTRSLIQVQQVLRLATEESGSTVPSILNRMRTGEVPPTYNSVNKLTTGFQTIVDSYGVADYQEVNPAPYTIITFPFLFAIMFGDAGHGLIMFLFALWMVLTEKHWLRNKGDNEIWNTIFAGRYIVLLMGLFSVYTGFIYNDVFSKSVNIFNSAWNIPDSVDPFNSTIVMYSLDPNTTAYSGNPYPFGMDPIWQSASNKIMFLNSYKMKLSVIFGVCQMLFGVFLSLMNSLYFQKLLNILCEFVPQLLFLLCIFGYLVAIIFFKWVHFDADKSGCAPNLLITLINMFLFKYEEKPCYLAEMYDGQRKLQTALVIIAIPICIPWMLFIKPTVLALQHNSQVHSGEQEGIGDLFIRQGIHTIEYCLGSISHTASYLRLWALSLAHAELSEVLWNMVFKFAIGSTNYLGSIEVYITFFFFGSLTIAILLVMEGLSAFLHALRLHWVEFQSKFYSGQGYAFTPFCFTTILEVEGA